MWLMPFHIHLAVRVLRQGGLIAYPTESVFGIGCDPGNLVAVERLLHIKSRSATKGLILVASSIEQLEPWVNFHEVSEMQPLIDSWPGHETWLIPARSHVSSLLTGVHNTLAVRVSAHPLVRRLCQKFGGAITSSSANRSGQKEAKDLNTAKCSFGNDIDYYVPGQVSGALKPSRIKDALTGNVIR